MAASPSPATRETSSNGSLCSGPVYKGNTDITGGEDSTVTLPQNHANCSKVEGSTSKDSTTLLTMILLLSLFLAVMLGAAYVYVHIR